MYILIVTCIYIYLLGLVRTQSVYNPPTVTLSTEGQREEYTDKKGNIVLPSICIIVILLVGHIKYRCTVCGKDGLKVSGRHR